MDVYRPRVSIVVAVLLLAAFASAGALAGRVAPSRTIYLPGAAVLLGAGLLFIPVRCATGVVASPFNDVSGLDRPTSCEGLAGVVLPELGFLSSDTVGYGLAIAAVGLAVCAAALVAGRRTTAERQR